MEKESHYYDITLPDGSGISLVRVTSILRVINKERLNEWRAKQGWELSEQYKEETADIGKEIHRLTAHLGAGKVIDSLQWELLDEEIKNGLKAYIRWDRKYEPMTLRSEVLVYSLKHRYAGTLDRICSVKDMPGLEIVDWKSGDTIWDEAVMQVAAYVEAWNELFGKPWIRRARIVCLNRKTGIPEPERIVLWDELKYAFKEGFGHANGLWQYYERLRHD